MLRSSGEAGGQVICWVIHRARRGLYPNKTEPVSPLPGKVGVEV